VRNAIVHNVPGGQVWISTAPGLLTIENTGATIPAERLGTLTEPFRQGQRDRMSGTTGVGLGLAIVTAVVRAHDAELRLTPRPSGGIRAVITFSQYVAKESTTRERNG
jgi:two-component system sensor histidine kinase VanS